MKFSDKTAGFALLCDANGAIRRWIRDDLDLANHYPSGQGLVRLVSRSDRPKLLSFLVETRTRGAAFNWELNLAIGDQISTLHLAGATAGDLLLVVGAKSSNGALQLYEEMMRINNEQVNALRAAAGEQAETARSQLERDDALYDQLSRLNNELVTLQRDLAKKNVELERLNKLKNQFLGMAAHDLRSPLAIIQTYSEFLLEEAGPNLDEEHLEFLSTIHASSQFMLQLITDLLDVSTIESGKLALDLQPTELTGLIEQNVALNAVLAKKKQIEVRGRLPETPVQVIADPAKLEQVLNNLVTNAVKFSHPDAVVEIRVAAENGRVVVSVVDEGQGIPAEELDKLFRPFSKTSVKSTGGEKSTGLGLMIVHKIVEGHGGEIWVESEVGRGSTFHFSLPLAAEPAPLTPPPAQDRTEAGGEPVEKPPLRLLLAEDNVLNQRIALRLLEQLGYQAEVVENGLEALQALAGQPYDLVLMDVNMPELDGLAASREIRRRFSAARQPRLVAMTAADGQQERAACLAAGMDDFISKPVKRDELRLILEKWSNRDKEDGA